MRWQPRRSLWRTPEGRHPRQLPRELFSLAPFSFSAHSYLPPPLDFFFLLRPGRKRPQTSLRCRGRTLKLPLMGKVTQAKKHFTRGRVLLTLTYTRHCAKSPALSRAFRSLAFVLTVAS